MQRKDGVKARGEDSYLPAKEDLRLPEARRKTGADFSSHTSEGSNTADTLTLNSWSADFETLNFQSLSHLACGTLFCQA